MVIPDDYPLGTYIVNGSAKDAAGNATPVTLKLIVGTDLQLALAQVIAQTTITGTLDNLTATFPATIPQVVVDAPYKINSRISLSTALPAGSLVSFDRDGFVVSDISLSGTGPWWYTQLVGAALSDAANFDAGYGGAIEHYSITISGNTEPIDTYLTIQSIISDDVFASDFVVLEFNHPAHRSTFGIGICPGNCDRPDHHHRHG